MCHQKWLRLVIYHLGWEDSDNCVRMSGFWNISLSLSLSPPTHPWFSDTVPSEHLESLMVSRGSKSKCPKRIIFNMAKEVMHMLSVAFYSSGHKACLLMGAVSGNSWSCFKSTYIRVFFFFCYNKLLQTSNHTNLLSFWRLEVQNGSHWAEIKVFIGICGGSRGESIFCLFQPSRGRPHSLAHGRLLPTSKPAMGS